MDSARLTVLILVASELLRPEVGSQASRPREGCFNSSPSDLGMARGTIPDSDITASSMINSHSNPHFARLGNSKAWTADTKDFNPWIQVNLQKAITVTAIATQGFSGSYVRQYYLSYSVSGNQWMNYTTQGVTKVFQANQNDMSVAAVVLNPLVVAQYIRLHPTNCSKSCALRMELYDCNSTAGQKFDKNCSSYVVHTPPQQNGINWEDSMGLCKAEDELSALVSIETQEELNFVKKKLIEIDPEHEYYIGLKKYRDNKWKWISGNGIVPAPPGGWASGNGNCAKMYFKDTDVVYDDIECDTKRKRLGYICEKLNDCQDKCTGECMRHSPAPTTTAPPRMTSASLTESKKSTSTARGQANSPDSTESTTSATVPNDPKIAVVAACLGAVLFLALIGLAVVLVLRRKKRRGKDAEKPKMSCSKQSESQYESVEPAAEAARLLGKHEVNITANSKKEQPKVESEYAVVNKANKKPKRGDLVYAQLAEFDDTNNDVKAAEKLATYEPTVYAEVVPSDVYHEASPDSSQPTYENVKNTGV